MSAERHDCIANGSRTMPSVPPPTPDERDHGHVPCVGTTVRLQEINEALALVADSVPAVEPPASLKARVIAAVAAQLQEPSREPAFAARSDQVMEAAIAGGSSGQAATPNIQTKPPVASWRATFSDWKRCAHSARPAAAFLGDRPIRRAPSIASDMREVSLAGRDAVAAAARAVLELHARTTGGSRSDAGTAAPGRIYQVWVIDGGQLVSAGLLGDQSSGVWHGRQPSRRPHAPAPGPP